MELNANSRSLLYFFRSVQITTSGSTGTINLLSLVIIRRCISSVLFLPVWGYVYFYPSFPPCFFSSLILTVLILYLFIPCVIVKISRTICAMAEPYVTFSLLICIHRLECKKQAVPGRKPESVLLRSMVLDCFVGRLGTYICALPSLPPSMVACRGITWEI